MLNIIIIFIFLLIILTRVYRKPSNYPPGPPQLPIIGNLISVWWYLRKYKYHHKVWQVWSEMYGPVLGLRLGFIDLVVISGRDTIKEVASREVFDGRPDGFFFRMRNLGEKIGLVFSDGPVWNKTRRDVLRGLKNFGYGTSVMEKYINEECKALVEQRMADAGKPFVANHMFDVCVVNVLWRLIAGKRYDLDDEKLKTTCYTITKLFRVADMSGGILNFMPFLRHIAPELSGYKELKKTHDSLYDFIKETVKEHQETIDLKNPRDVIDTLLIEMAQKKDSYSLKELLVICNDFLEAGMETVSNTADYLMLYIVSNQELQNKVRKEIDEEIGHSRSPVLSDRSRMVYTEAVILEALRISSVAAVGIPHVALETARIGDYVIPKSTVILFALYDLHNGSHWEMPSEFRPERFISKDGNLIQVDSLLAFGSGRRRCIGEALARNELFLFLTNILQNFTVKLPEGDPLPNTEPVNGITLSAQDFRVVLEPRKIWY